MDYKKYDVIFGKFPIEEDGSVQSGERPAIVIQNNIGNKYSPTLLVLPLSSQLKKIKMPTHMILERDRDNGLTKTSMLVAEQPKTINKNKVKKIGRIMNRELQRKIFRCFVYSAAYGDDDDDLSELNFARRCN